MPTYQLVLHLNDHLLRTGFLDRASHGHYKSYVPDHFKRGSLGMVGGNIFSTFKHPPDHDWIDSGGRNRARAPRI